MEVVEQAKGRRGWRRAWKKNSSLQLTLYSHKLLLYHTVLLRDEERVNSIVNLHDYLNVNSNSFVTFFHSFLISIQLLLRSLPHLLPSHIWISFSSQHQPQHSSISRVLTHSLNHHSYFNLIIVHIIFYFFHYYDYISIIWFLIFHDMHFLSSFCLLPTRITYNFALHFFILILIANVNCWMPETQAMAGR